MSLTVIAKIKAKKGKTEFIKSELVKLIEPTRKEEGCIQYVLHQDNNDPSIFIFVENWLSKELLDKHLSNEHLKKYLENTEGSVEEFIINEMKIVK